jgi:predicted dehydrogenase
MSTKLTIWGTQGRIYADRQECQVYLRAEARVPEGYREGWSVRYTTELTEPVWFYMRGEEYSAQLDHFVRCMEEGAPSRNRSTFADGVQTDRALQMIQADAAGRPRGQSDDALSPARAKRRRSFFRGD